MQITNIKEIEFVRSKDEVNRMLQNGYVLLQVLVDRYIESCQNEFSDVPTFVMGKCGQE